VTRFQPICPDCRTDDDGDSYLCDPSRTLCPRHDDPNPGVAHVVPRGDSMEHETSDDCACGPSPLAETRPDGSIDWIVVHHSLDGREASE
jgi:hypothetical protein